MPTRVAGVLGRSLATALGAVLRGAVVVLTKVRSAAKPMHPRGVQYEGTLHRSGGDRTWGVAWLDDGGAAPVRLRLSRGAGLPDQLPDVLGLALHVDGADLLLSSTGVGRIGRFLLVPRRRYPGSYTSLMPYRTAGGPLLLRADVDDAVRRIELSAVGPAGRWHRFGVIEVGTRIAGDPLISFDPVLRTIPGLPSYEWAARLREGAYRSARTARGGRHSRHSAAESPTLSGRKMRDGPLP